MWNKIKYRKCVCVSERLCGCVRGTFRSVSFITTYIITIGNRGLLTDLGVLPGLDWVSKTQRGTSSGWTVPTWLQGKADDSFQQHLFSSPCDCDIPSTLVNFLFLVVLSWRKTHNARAEDCIAWGDSLSERLCDQLHYWICEKVDVDHLEAELNKEGP